MIGRNSSLLQHVTGGFVEINAFAAYVLCTLTVIQIWNFSTYYINMHGRNGLRDHVFICINMYLLYLIGQAMLYVVFTFGEMIIVLAGYFDDRITPGTIYLSLMGFLIIVGLFLSYETAYDHLIDREKKDNGLLYMLLHIFLIFALNLLTTSLDSCTPLRLT